MKKRSVTKLLSIVLAASMIATYAAPLNSSAAEISVADETQTVDEATEQDSVETEELLDTKKSEDMEENESQGISVPEVSVKDQKNVGDRQSRELSNGIFDAWTQDPVSYTHLDVYKRQALRGANPALYSFCRRHVDVCQPHRAWTQHFGCRRQ